MLEQTMKALDKHYSGENYTYIDIKAVLVALAKDLEEINESTLDVDTNQSIRIDLLEKRIVKL